MLKNLYIICGPSGSGKTTVVDRLERRYGYRQLRSYTTRPRRTPDEDGHTFVTEDDYLAMKDDIVAYLYLSGNHYWTTQELADDSDLYVLDPEGLAYMREHYSGSRPLRVIGIHAPKDLLMSRMRNRGDSEEAIRTRMEVDETLFATMFDVADFVVDNQDLVTTLALVKDYIDRCEAES